jgi:hypothetical protein
MTLSRECGELPAIFSYSLFVLPFSVICVSVLCHEHTGVVKSLYIKFSRHIFMSYVCVYDFLEFYVYIRVFS